MAQHREALEHLVQRAEQRLDAAGMRSSPGIARRARATLSAAAADRRKHPLLRAGRLSEEIAPGGFEVLGAVPAPRLTLVRSPKGPGRIATSHSQRQEVRRRNAAEREQRQAMQREAKAQQRQAIKRKAEMARRQRRIDQAGRQAARLREQLRKVEERIERERRSGDHAGLDGAAAAR
jgi:hypothetical protein